jgi:hypothetical protein
MKKYISEHFQFHRDIGIISCESQMDMLTGSTNPFMCWLEVCPRHPYYYLYSYYTHVCSNISFYSESYFLGVQCIETWSIWIPTVISVTQKLVGIGISPLVGLNFFLLRCTLYQEDITISVGIACP